MAKPLTFQIVGWHGNPRAFTMGGEAPHGASMTIDKLPGRESSVALMREAADLEASTPKHAVTPGPILPTHKQLGDLLMEQNQPGEALVAYQRSIVFYPGRFNGLLGAARAARAHGDESMAHSFYQQFLELAIDGTRQPAVKEAQEYVAYRK